MLTQSVIIRNADTVDRAAIVIAVDRNTYTLRVLYPDKPDVNLEGVPLFATEAEMVEWLEAGHPRRRAAFVVERGIALTAAQIDEDIERLLYGYRQLALDHETLPPGPGESKTQSVPDADAVIFGEPGVVAEAIKADAQAAADALAEQPPEVKDGE